MADNKLNKQANTEEEKPDGAAGEVKPTGKTVKIKLPRAQGVNANQQEFFSVNFKNYLIERGKYVEVPEELAEVIRNGEAAEEAAFEYAAENAAKEPGM